MPELKAERRGDEIGTRSGREVVALGWVGRWIGVIKSLSVRQLRGRYLARGGADPSGFPNRTVRGKQTAQTAQAVRLR